METIKVKAKAIKETFSNGDYRIFSWSPLQVYEDIQLSPYMTFSTKGNTPFITEGREYTLELELIKHDTKWGDSFKIVDVPSMRLENLSELTREQQFEMLMDITSSERIANNILDAYPNFFEIILTKGKQDIDLKKIHGVGEKYLNAYDREINLKYKYLGLISKLKDYKVDVSDCKTLYNLYDNEYEIERKINENPYRVLTEVLDRSFNKSDKLILELKPELHDSEIRCEAIMMDVLKRNEQDGSSRLNGNILWNVMIEDYNAPSEWAKTIKELARNSEQIYYDEESKDLARMNTYLGECLIADFIKEKISNPIIWDFDWEKFKEIKEGFLTDEQSNVLKYLCENNLVILNASAGCVDCETEFFNGKEWKKISEYKKGEYVLQCDKDGNSNLVLPERYIKEPCDKMYHFETKYGLNQTLSPEHIVPYYTTKGHFHTTTAQEIYHKQNFENGFHGKILTTFKYNGEGIDLTDEEIKIMCAVICDGSFYNFSKEHQDSYKTCRFHIKKERKKIALRNLFKEANIEWRESESSAKGYTDFYIKAPRREKIFSEYWYNCSQHQLQIICDNLMQWDGSINETKNGVERKRFSTNVLATANFVQFAYSACGYRASIYINDRRGREKINKKTGKTYIDKTLEYNISITKKTLCGFTYDNRPTRKKTIVEEVKPLDGYKYCFTVPKDYLVLRRDNKIFITHNCGKTSSMLALIQMLEYYKKTYKCVTATGKAAKRLSESINGRPASTIHRACLGEKTISTDVLIVDEHSFLSIDLMVMLINAIDNPNMKILLIGDIEQIPNLSLGKPIRDMIESGIVPVCSLTKCFRFGIGGISTVSTLARQGKMYIDENTFNNDEPVFIGKNKDYEFIPFDNTMEQITNCYSKLLNKYNLKPKDICIITPYNVRTFGTININNAIQEIVNPPKPNENTIINEFIKNNVTYKTIFREGDIVMNTVNNYSMTPLESWEEIQKDPQLQVDDLPKVECMNGEIGKILEIKDNIMKIQFDENIIIFNKMDAKNLLLAYASNPYKMQGSQCKWIINLTISEHQKSLNRQLLYTALTRAKDGLIEIGELNIIKQAINTLGDIHRDTWLKDLLLDNSN